MDMRVANIYNAYSVYNTKSASGVRKSDRAGKADAPRDELQRSAFMEEYQIAKKALANVPDVRADKVSQYKSRLEANSYHVNAETLAAKMLKGADG